MKKLTIEEMQRMAAKRGGRCLSELYINSSTKLLWECVKAHQWVAIPGHIKNGHWCPYCAGKAKGTIEDMRRIAEEHGGKCLSDTYVNTSTKLFWECMRGHQWKARPDSIKRGHWCPYCAGRVKGTIEEMRRIAEEHEGKCLSEIYINSKTKLLWECAKGHQWKTIPSDIKNKGSWCPYCSGQVKGTIKDMRIIAEERGGKCLSVDYIDNKAKLLWECSQGHQWEAIPHSIKKGKWCPHCAGVAKGTLEEMQSIAEEQGGRCLSETYFNKKTKLLWECTQSHQWKATPDAIKRGHWCPYCAGLAKGTVEEMRSIAEERDGKCLSDTYINSSTKLLWECAKGHQWKATPNMIKRGTWCPYCAGNVKKTLKDMQRMAKEQGGKCLSDAYINDSTKLIWECAESHQWKAKPNDIKNGHWCPYCVGQIRGTIDDMQRMAEERGGKCLSDIYFNRKTKLLWECAKGHKWEAMPGMIKKGTWCPYCAGKVKGTIEGMQRMAEERSGKCMSDTYINNSTKLRGEWG